MGSQVLAEKNEMCVCVNKGHGVLQSPPGASYMYTYTHFPLRYKTVLHKDPINFVRPVGTSRGFAKLPEASQSTVSFTKSLGALYTHKQILVSFSRDVAP